MVSRTACLLLFQEQTNQVVFIQVSSATATFAMTFSSSMSVVEYYLLKRFPIPYGSALRPPSYLSSFCNGVCTTNLPFLSPNHAALYFVAISLVAAFVGQHVVRRLIEIMGRASLIIFILAFTIFVSAISLGKLHIVSSSTYRV